MLEQFKIIIPELSLFALAILSQLFAVIFTKKNNIIYYLTIILAWAIALIVMQTNYTEIIGFNDSFAGGANNHYKAIILMFTTITIMLYKEYCVINAQELKFEFLTLVLLSTLGIFIAISARNFLLLFCSIELTALVGYVLAGFKLNDIKSSESALKYFILGSLISCLSLFGISFIYGFGGSLQFNDILYTLNSTSNNMGLVIGIILFLTSIFFKLSAAPLQSWAPDVYDGAPISSVIYFSTAAKFGIVIILLNIVNFVLGNYTSISIQLIKIISILSMIFGALGAIKQNSLKRLMAYSTILNIGYVLIGIVLHHNEGYFAAVAYMVIYAVSTLGFFTCLLMLTGTSADSATFESIKNIALQHKTLAALLSIIMFSMIGIPPLAGFFGKYYIFYQAIREQEYLLSFIGIFTSVIAAFYYLKVIKTMYFAEKPAVIIKNSVSSISLFTINTFIMAFLLFASLFISF